MPLSEENKPPKEIVMGIVQEYLQRNDPNQYDYVIQDDVIGRTMENYIKQIKVDEAYNAIEFTLHLLKETKKYVE